MYDSGVGGLSVLRHLWRLLPRTPVIYVADSGRAPYGGRPPEQIVAFGIEIARELRERGVRLLVVACNTSSSVALPQVEEAFDGPVVGMLRPAAEAAAARWPQSGAPIGLLATATTVASAAYPRALAAFASHLDVVQEACPEWVPLVESGTLDGEEVEHAVARHVLPLLGGRRVRGMLLGCTHYPFLRPVLERVAAAAGYGSVPVLDPAHAVAREVGRLFPAMAEDCSRRSTGIDRFLTSGDPATFEALFRRLVGAEHEASGREWGGVGALGW